MTGTVRGDDDDESVLDLAEQTNRPDDTAFNQQRIKAWSPILDPVWVIIGLFYLGVIMVPVGYKIDSLQKDVVEMKITYDGLEDPICGIGQTFNADKNCTLAFVVPENMNPPVLVHYELTNFHQNHRSYYKNRDAYQLNGEDPSATIKDDCDPLYKLGDITLNPCGLTANTMFNDIFTLTSGKDAYGNDLVMSEEGIAWTSDLDYMFHQAKGFKSEECPSSSLERQNSTRTTCPADCCGDDRNVWSCTEPAYNKKDGKCYRYYYPDENTTQYLYETYPKIVSPLEGVTNEHFVVWMRIATLGDFRKLYGWINQPIAKGTVINFTVNANYVVTRFKGTKSLILTTTTIFGGQNKYLSTMFINIGIFCIVAAVFFTLKHYFRPRKLADPAYLHYKED